MLPDKYLEFKENFGSIIEKYDDLCDHIYKNGPLDKKTLRLIKLVYALASGSEGSVHAQVRKSKEQGIKKDELFHVLILGLTSLGLPKTVAGYNWIKETIDK
jgi:alkylhydroperoxidase/carboxymuconolactone decarboxylase family protein YurZ